MNLDYSIFLSLLPPLLLLFRYYYYYSYSFSYSYYLFMLLLLLFFCSLSLCVFAIILCAFVLVFALLCCIVHLLLAFVQFTQYHLFVDSLSQLVRFVYVFVAFSQFIQSILYFVFCSYKQQHISSVLLCTNIPSWRKIVMIFAPWVCLCIHVIFYEMRAEMCAFAHL